MKNRKKVIRVLIVLIVILLGVATVYTSLNRERFMTFLESSNSSNRNDKNEGSTSTPPNSNDGDNYIYNEDNEENNNSDIINTPVDPNDYGFLRVSTYQDFADLLARPDRNMFFVLGRSGCYYCEQYLPVLQDVSMKYKIEVVYLDLAEFDPGDYSNVLNSPLKIPAKCSKTGEETTLRGGFGTPLSLFVNNSKTYDCIRGYKDEENLVSLLRGNHFIN